MVREHQRNSIVDADLDDGPPDRIDSTAATPPRCPAGMPVQRIEFWTPGRIGVAMVRLVTMRPHAAMPVAVAAIRVRR